VTEICCQYLDGVLSFSNDKLTCLPDTPRNASKQVICKKSVRRLRRDRDRDQASHGYETAQDRAFVPKSFGNDTIDVKTNNLSTVGGLLEHVSIAGKCN
jgi:hypothetical protein